MGDEDGMKRVQGLSGARVERVCKEAEEARRAEYEADVAARGDEMQGGQSNAPNSFNINTDNSWYFYNRTAVQAGRTEFQKRWLMRRRNDE